VASKGGATADADGVVAGELGELKGAFEGRGCTDGADGLGAEESIATGEEGVGGTVEGTVVVLREHPAAIAPANPIVRQRLEHLAK
jgi:hypothetical protein